MGKGVLFFSFILQICDYQTGSRCINFFRFLGLAFDASNYRLPNTCSAATHIEQDLKKLNSFGEGGMSYSFCLSSLFFIYTYCAASEITESWI